MARRPLLFLSFSLIFDDITTMHIFFLIRINRYLSIYLPSHQLHQIAYNSIYSFFFSTFLSFPKKHRFSAYVSFPPSMHGGVSSYSFLKGFIHSATGLFYNTSLYRSIPKEREEDRVRASKKEPAQLILSHVLSTHDYIYCTCTYIQYTPMCLCL
ncbi:hypothetical protein VTN96DRAFT_5519 [Rasamsonia emersonii]